MQTGGREALGPATPDRSGRVHGCPEEGLQRDGHTSGPSVRPSVRPAPSCLSAQCEAFSAASLLLGAVGSLGKSVQGLREEASPGEGFPRRTPSLAGSVTVFTQRKPLVLTSSPCLGPAASSLLRREAVLRGLRLVLPRRV